MSDKEDVYECIDCEDCQHFPGIDNDGYMHCSHGGAILSENQMHTGSCPKFKTSKDIEFQLRQIKRRL